MPIAAQSYSTLHGGSVRVIDMRPRRRARGRGSWDGTAWVCGVEFTGLNSDPTKPYVHLDASNPEPAAYESDIGYSLDGNGRRCCPVNIEIIEKRKIGIAPPRLQRM
jgi:hypothetical protein